MIKLFSLLSSGLCCIGFVSSLAAQTLPTDLTANDSFLFAESNSDAPRGVIRSAHSATLSAEIANQITQMPFREGQAFKKGARLVSFDCRRHKADYRAAQASIEVRKRAVETNQELEKFQSIGRYELLISEAELNKANAEAESIKIVLDGCNIKAPFNGKISQVLANRYESVTLGQPILEILSTESLEIELILPSDWLSWLAPGTPFNFSIDETGATITANITRLFPLVDPVSKTIKVIGKMTGEPDKTSTWVLPGMSGSAEFPDEPKITD